jgi:hypothetical protein
MSIEGVIAFVLIVVLIAFVAIITVVIEVIGVASAVERRCGKVARHRDIDSTIVLFDSGGAILSGQSGKNTEFNVFREYFRSTDM